MNSDVKKAVDSLLRELAADKILYEQEVDAVRRMAFERLRHLSVASLSPAQIAKAAKKAVSQAVKTLGWSRRNTSDSAESIDALVTTLSDILSKLPVETSRLVNLVLKGHSLAEIAMEMATSKTSASRKVNAAIRQLRTQMIEAAKHDQRLAEALSEYRD